MATQTLGYIDAIAHLPAGGTLTLTDVYWEEYEQLLADLGDNYAVRISYDHGRLEIMSPSLKQENFAETISALGHILAEELDIVVESLGSTTYKQEWLGRGVEPDACFYVQNAARIIGKERVDLSIDPPPDIVVEIDISHSSAGKFTIYAELGVPEFWHCDGSQTTIHHLVDGSFVQASNSRAFPALTSAALTKFLEQSRTQGQTAALRSFREWLRAQRV